MKEDNSKKIILDLCGGTGSWSRPYKEAGYDVKIITAPDYDVRTVKYIQESHSFSFHGQAKAQYIDIEKIYGVLAAPPCTMFSFARTKAKELRDLSEGMLCVRACLETIWKIQETRQDTGQKHTRLKFWALENPSRGLLRNFLGKPAFIFNPFEFGDMYKKETALWGNFKEPIKIYSQNGALLKLKKFDKLKTKEIHPEQYGNLTRTERRAITPAGFAKAFFEANK